MKHTALFFLSLLLLSVAGCNKESNDPNDLTTDIVGHYTNSFTLADIVVNKVDDTHVSIAVEDVTASYYISESFTNVTMNSKTTFTLNSVVDSTPFSGCEGTLTYTGTGTASNNNISVFLTITASNVGVNDPCLSGTETLSGSK